MCCVVPQDMKCEDRVKSGRISWHLKEKKKGTKPKNSQEKGQALQISVLFVSGFANFSEAYFVAKSNSPKFKLIIWTVEWKLQLNSATKIILILIEQKSSSHRHFFFLFETMASTKKCKISPSLICFWVTSYCVIFYFFIFIFGPNTPR